MKKIMMVTLVSSTLALSGCGAMSTAIKKRNLEVKTQMSQTIWLDPSSERTVYLQVKNTSDKDMSDLQSLIAKDIQAKRVYCGYLTRQSILLDSGQRAEGRQDGFA